MLKIGTKVKEEGLTLNRKK